MRRRAAVVVFVIVLLFSAMSVSQRIEFASAQTVATISGEGTIIPSFAPIKQDREVYTLTGDLGALVIARSSITLDGNGHTITGTFEDKKVHLPYVENVTLRNLVVKGGAYGIFMDHTSNVTVTNNTIVGTSVPFPQSQGTAGIYIYAGANITIMQNRLENNVKGILLVDSLERNVVCENNLTSNHIGMDFLIASNNDVYHNNFINNSLQILDSGAELFQANITPSVNIWDNGYPHGGNYWSDYQATYPNAVEIDDSGIGNASYVIDRRNKDRYPFMEPFTAATYLLQTTPPKISILSPLNQTDQNANVSLVFTVDKRVNWTGYNLDRKDNITITGNTTLIGVQGGLHDITVYANDTFGNMGTSETMTFTIPEPFPVVPIAAGVAVVAVIIGTAGLLLHSRKRRKEATPK